MPSAATATYDAGNQLATWNGTPATTDNNGNLLSDPSLNATYIWNERNQLSSATVGGVVSSFTYDALGRRVAQTAGSLTTQYVYDLLNVAQEQFSTGGVGDMLPGLGLDQNFSRVDSSGTSAVLPDMLGSTLGLVNSSGVIGTGYQYGPFGQTTSSGASSTNPIQYAGREMDPTGVYFMRARYYNPVLQRFVSQDPIGLSGGQVDQYAYAFNSPMNLTDPLGLKGGGAGLIAPPGPPLQKQGKCNDGATCYGDPGATLPGQINGNPYLQSDIHSLKMHTAEYFGVTAVMSLGTAAGVVAVDTLLVSTGVGGVVLAVEAAVVSIEISASQPGQTTGPRQRPSRMQQSQFLRPLHQCRVTS
jgi:RHS repeat-associated protein